MTREEAEARADQAFEHMSRDEAVTRILEGFLGLIGSVLTDQNFGAELARGWESGSIRFAVNLDEGKQDAGTTITLIAIGADGQAVPLLRRVGEVAVMVPA